MLLRFDDFDRTFSLLDDLHRRLDHAFQAPRAQRPFADLEVGEHELTLRADLPGVREADVELTLENEVLTLAAKREVELPEGYRPHLRERRGLELRQSYALPVPVDPEKVSARLVDGVLTVKLAKAEAARPRTITVTR